MPVSMKRLVAAVALVGTLLGVSATSAGAQDPEAPSINDVAASDGRFETLVLALQQTGLADMFADCDSGDVYTVLAPTDDAFTAAREGGDIAATVFDDAEVVASLLSYHVVKGAVPAEVVLTLAGASTTTVNGEDILVAVDGDAISIVSAAEVAANVVVVDVQACNGIIHAIDNVLLPPTIASALEIGQDDTTDDEAVEPEAELANTGAGSGLVIVAGVAVLAAGALLSTTGRRHRMR